MTRGLGAALLLCLAGAVLLLAGSSADWLSLTLERDAPLPDGTVRLSGADLVPGLRALGVLALAGVPALLAVRRLGRVLVGALLLLAGTGAVALVGRVLAAPAEQVASSDAFRQAVGVAGFSGDPALAAAAYAALVGGVLLAAAGLLAVVRGRAWPALGRRYDAPAARPATAEPAGDKQVWEALDRGEDPTR